MNSIQIFACDHRKNVQWNLPYIRFGGPESDCAIKIDANNIFEIEVNPDEAPKIFWLWKNLEQLGNPDVIGYCQYRRFYSTINTTIPVINIKQSQFNSKFVLTPLQQLQLMVQNNADGIFHPHFKIINENLIPYKYIWDQIRIHSKNECLQEKYYKYIFDLLLKYTQDDLKESMKQSFEVKENYLCNIFTVKTPLFKEFGQVAFNALKELLETMTTNEKKELHPYWLAYIFERYTSCYYHALEISGKCHFLKIPLLTIEAEKHIKWNKNSL